MTWKIAAPFAIGAVVATGTAYWTTKPQPAPSLAAVISTLPQREKPSPMPVTVAYQQPPAMTEPINKTRPYNDARPADDSRQSDRPNQVILLAGTVLPVRIGETISAARNQKGDTFLATLDEPLVIDGFIIAERGARAEGRIVELDPPGRGRATARLDIQLMRLSTADGQYIKIHTESFHRETANDNGKDVATVAAGAAIGAAIGGASGSGKGAGIGAAAGGAAGLAGVLLTRGRPLDIPVETRIAFRMAEAVKITEHRN